MTRPTKHEEFAKLFHLSLDMLCIADFNGYFKALNPAWERTLGYSIEELLSKPYVEFIHPDDRESTAVEADRLSSGEQVIRFHNRYRTKEGTYRWLSWMSTPVREQRLIYAIARDITEAKQAQEELRLARAQAEEATRAKSEFVAGVSHEIRSPMNAIIGMTELALGSKLTKRQREYLQTAKSAAVSLMKVIEEVLDFSKIETRKVTIERIEFKLRETLEDTLKPLVFRAKRQKLRLICKVRRGTPNVLVGDPNRLRQVLMNLIGNAIKFTPKGNIVVSAEMESETDDSQLLRFSIRDSGIGIAKEKQKSIFDAFTQADSSTTREYGGTGLGLSISNELIRLMGGSLHLESAVNKGSTFSFTVQCGRRQKPAAASQSKRSGAHDVPFRVLLAEDNPVNQRLMTELLERAGHRITVVKDGRAAVDAAGNGAFDLVLMDIQMPVLGGIEATIAIRENEKKLGRHTPIVAMTAHAVSSDRDRAISAGMDDYITKPVGVEELYRRIQRAVLLCGFGGNSKLAAEVIDVFFAEYPKMLARVVGAVRRRRPEAIQQSAHALKGTIGNFTVAAPFEAARKLERAGRAKDLTRVSSLLAEVKDETRKLVQSLRVLRGGLR